MQLLGILTSKLIWQLYEGRSDWNRRYVENPNAFHASYALPELPEFALLRDDVTNFDLEQVNSN